MGQLTGLGQKKTFKLAKKGKMSCITCDQFLPVIKLPQNLPFIQDKTQLPKTPQSDKNVETKFCQLCGHGIKTLARFCENCGGEQ